MPTALDAQRGAGHLADRAQNFVDLLQTHDLARIRASVQHPEVENCAGPRGPRPPSESDAHADMLHAYGVPFRHRRRRGTSRVFRRPDGPGSVPGGWMGGPVGLARRRRLGRRPPVEGDRHGPWLAPLGKTT